jgi:hypothetical protein
VISKFNVLFYLLMKKNKWIIFEGDFNQKKKIKKWIMGLFK